MFDTRDHHTESPPSPHLAGIACWRVGSGGSVRFATPRADRTGQPRTRSSGGHHIPWPAWGQPRVFRWFRRTCTPSLVRKTHPLSPARPGRRSPGPAPPDRVVACAA